MPCLPCQRQGQVNRELTPSRLHPQQLDRTKARPRTDRRCNGTPRVKVRTSSRRDWCWHAIASRVTAKSSPRRD